MDAVAVRKGRCEENIEGGQGPQCQHDARVKYNGKLYCRMHYNRIRKIESFLELLKGSHSEATEPDHAGDHRIDHSRLRKQR